MISTTSSPMIRLETCTLRLGRGGVAYLKGGQMKLLHIAMITALIGIALLSGCAEHQQLYIKNPDTQFETAIYIHRDGDNLIYRRSK